jgi:hypothetical protein
MRLASETKKGQIYIQKEKALADQIAKRSDTVAIELGDGATHVDRIFVRDNKVRSIAEIKNRNMSLSQLQKFGSYLISYEKIDRGVALSSLMHVPFYLFVYLISSDDIVYWKVSDETGREVCNYTIERTKTKADVNGGIAMRENAYIQLDGMTILSPN